MKTRGTRWAVPLIAVSYVLVSNLALASQARLWAAVAVALFAALLAQVVTWRLIRIVLAIGGLVMALGVARGVLAPVALLLPPVLVPVSIAWMFGSTLRGGRVPLVERFARAVHAPEPLDAEHVRYTRGVTVMWTGLLAIMAVVNGLLVLCVYPGGMLDQFGYQPGWTVDMPTFLWVTNGIYLMVPLILVAEYVFRLHRFPRYRLRNPLEFARLAFERLPAVIKEAPRD